MIRPVVEMNPVFPDWRHFTLTHQFQRVQDTLYSFGNIGFLIKSDLIQDFFSDDFIFNLTIQIIKSVVNTFPFFLTKQIFTESNLINLFPSNQSANLDDSAVSDLPKSVFKASSCFGFRLLKSSCIPRNLLSGGQQQFHPFFQR